MLVSEFVLNTHELTFVGWMVYFAMQGSSNLVLYKHLKERFKLVYGIVATVFSVVFAVTIIYVSVV